MPLWSIKLSIHIQFHIEGKTIGKRQKLTECKGCYENDKYYFQIASLQYYHINIKYTSLDLALVIIKCKWWHTYKYHCNIIFMSEWVLL